MKFHCELCEYETDVREKYAGHKSGHTRRKERAKNLPKPQKMHVCNYCGTQFETGPKLGFHKGNCRLSQRLFDQLGGPKTRKNFLVRERGYACEVCKNSEWMNQPIPLQMDHIDGDSDNNEKSNLRLLCPNCHAQTETYCGKNMGRIKHITRHGIKMQRYYDKKTDLVAQRSEQISLKDCVEGSTPSEVSMVL